MSIFQNIKNTFSSIRKTNNSIQDGISNGREFLRYGNRKPLTQDWSRIEMSDAESYSDYLYAAVTNRANKVSQLAHTFLVTDSSDNYKTIAEKEKKDIIHPYLEKIDESKGFTNNEFWYGISTYLDLEGVYYLMVVRKVTPNLIGDVQSFEMLNPYEVQRVINQETMEIGGYIENRNGLYREIPKEMIIEIKKFNPFSRFNNYSMTDAAKGSQFTLKQAGDYTRHSLKNNMSSPGIVSTGVLLEPELFKNFVSRITSQEKGMPLFANGPGAISFDPMQIDLDKASLATITDINRSTLFAVTGVSKTTMGIEESGTTRDVSVTQKDKFIEDHIMPQVQLIIDALNQDYKNTYPDEYKKNKLTIEISNPLSSDVDTTLKEIEANTKKLDLYNALISFGYESEKAAKYANGDLSIEELGEPTLEPEMTEEEIQALANLQLEKQNTDQQQVS